MKRQRKFSPFVSPLAREVARYVFALEAADEIEEWEAATADRPRRRHPLNPGRGDWLETIPAPPHWFAAEIERVTLAPLEAIAGDRELADVWIPWDGPDHFAWNLANMITGDGGGCGWWGEPPPQPVAGGVYVTVTPSTVRLEWVTAPWRFPLAVARRRLADARRRNPTGNAAQYWAARVDGLINPRNP